MPLLIRRVDILKPQSTLVNSDNAHRPCRSRSVGALQSQVLAITVSGLCGRTCFTHNLVTNAIDLVHDLVYYTNMEVNIHQAKTHLSRLLERVALGEEVIIAKAGTPVAKLVPVNKQSRKRIFGSAKGEFTVPDDFNEPDPEIEDMFYK